MASRATARFLLDQALAVRRFLPTLERKGMGATLAPGDNQPPLGRDRGSARLGSIAIDTTRHRPSSLIEACEQSVDVPTEVELAVHERTAAVAEPSGEVAIV